MCPGETICAGDGDGVRWLERELDRECAPLRGDKSLSCSTARALCVAAPGTKTVALARGKCDWRRGGCEKERATVASAVTAPVSSAMSGASASDAAAASALSPEGALTVVGGAFVGGSRVGAGVRLGARLRAGALAQTTVAGRPGGRARAAGRPRAAGAVVAGTDSPAARDALARVVRLRCGGMVIARTVRSEVMSSGDASGRGLPLLMRSGSEVGFDKPLVGRQCNVRQSVRDARCRGVPHQVARTLKNKDAEWLEEQISLLQVRGAAC
jgi:hypothetical protein